MRFCVATALWIALFSIESSIVNSFVVPCRTQKSSIGANHYGLAAYSDEAPSDYDSADMPGEKHVEVDMDEDDAVIRDELKRELLLLASVTNRGEYATKDEQNIIVDLVSQLEALNPTEDPAHNSQGEWNLVLSSTQLFRSSPFFQSIRVALGDAIDGGKSIAENGFDLHDRATTAGRIGKIRQVISDTEFISEVDLETGMVPGMPFRMTGTVVTTAALDIVSDELWELKVEKTQVKGSNVPLLNQLLEEPQLELPVSSIYNTIQGKVPSVPIKTFYVDEAVRISRDIDDNFFVFSRA